MHQVDADRLAFEFVALEERLEDPFSDRAGSSLGFLKGGLVFRPLFSKRV